MSNNGYNCHSALCMIRLQMGIAAMDNMVVSTTLCVANSSSPWYFMARIAVVVPAGMAARVTETPATTESMFASQHPANTTAGIKARRMKE